MRGIPHLVTDEHVSFQPYNVFAEEAGAAAKASLQKVITWCTTDAAGPSLGLLRTALLDLASVLLAEKAVPGALACLQAAATAGACLDALLAAPQDLGAVAAAALPAWVSTLLQGELYMPPGSMCTCLSALHRCLCTVTTGSPDKAVSNVPRFSCLR